MTHKQKCEALRKIRMNIAEKLGLQNQIRQTPCNFQGECSGTCPACEKEERLLNRAMIGKTALIAGTCLTLTACEPFTLDGETIYTDNLDYKVSSQVIIDEEKHNQNIDESENNFPDALTGNVVIID